MVIVFRYDPLVAEQRCIFYDTEFFYIGQTITHHEIHCLADIKATGKTTVIRPEKGTDVFPGLLVCFINWYPLSHDLSGIDHVRNLRHRILAAILPLHKPIELAFISLRNEVPDLVCPQMTIVQWVDLAVLNMPAEGSKLHPHIQPRDSHPTDVLLVLVTYFEQRVLAFV